MAIVLPTEQRGPSKRWQDQKFLNIGAGKVGKSDFWSHGQHTFFFEFEPGLNHLSVMSLPCRSWDDFTEVCAELYRANAAKKFPYDTLVIDTGDKFIDRANDYVIERAKEKYKADVADKINSVGDIPNGAGWFQAKELVSLTLDKLVQFPAALVVICHVKTEKLKDGTREYNHDTINIGGQVGTSLLHWADHTLYWRTRTLGDRIERCLRTKPCEQFEAGSRGLVIPDGFKIEEDVEASYGKFRSLFT